MDIATIGLSVFLVTAQGRAAAPPQPRIIATALARAAQNPAVAGAERLTRPMARQPPLRMPATRATRGVFVALGVVVGAYAGAYIGEELGENLWGFGLPIGAVAGGVLAFLATQ